MRQQQQGEVRPARPTVGDTLTVVHRVQVPIGSLVQPRGPTDSTIATLVGPPVVSREGDSVRIAYTMAVWAPGQHSLVIPGAVTLSGTGTVDTLPDATVRFEVASLLPENISADSVPPQAAQPWIQRSEASGWPFLVLLAPLLLFFVAAALWWRRRGKVVAAPAPDLSNPAAIRDRLERWRAAGESALVVDHLMAVLPDDAVTAAWRARVDAVRFDPGARAELDRLMLEGMQLFDTVPVAR